MSLHVTYNRWQPNVALTTPYLCLVTAELEEGIGPLKLESNVVTYKPPCGFWELDLGPLDELLVLITTAPSLQP